MAKKANKSEQALVIVESPAKAKTINRYLGSGYEVMASMGHVRDLPASGFGIDLENDFEPVYQVLPDRKKTVNSLKKAADGAGRVFLATDLDREGEAIAWHLVSALDLDPKTTKRVVFNEITKSAIQAAFSDPHDLDMDKVNAQQARRLLDRIVGYQLSPLLQQKIGKGLSAGRVQSVAVKLIVDRENEIRAFIPEESWRIGGYFTTDFAHAADLIDTWTKFNQGGKDADSGRTNKEKNAWLAKHNAFSAELIKINGAEFNPTRVAEARQAAESLGFVCDEVDEQDFAAYADKGLKIITLRGRTDPAIAPKFAVADVATKRTQSRPNAPFTTAALQQAASSALGFAPSRTMRVAQQLYEGIDLGGSEGQVGLITYMRTDSTNLSQDSIQSVRGLIGKQFGDRYLPDRPNVYGNTKRAQEAHEAIRPSDATRTPQSVQQALSAEQYKLYELIWKRFVACQMTPAEWDSTTVLVSAKSETGEATFKANGRRLIFDGFLRVMGTIDDGEGLLPELKTGAPVAPLQIDPQQNYTSPPPRYTEAALVKKMEAEGIGRPSTYAAVIQTIQDRSYVELTDKRLHPTARGEVVTNKLVEHFPTIMDIKFTSYMEEELDKIEEAHLDWVHVLREFYEPFKSSLDKAQVGMEKTRAEPSEYVCDLCGKPMVYRLGKNGRFLSCSGYPECKTTLNVDAEGTPVAHIVGDVPCVKCGKPMILRRSRMGPFLGCSGYPECDSTAPCDDDGVALKKIQAEELEEKCADCGSKMSVKWARGRSFLGCSNYPKCKATKQMPAGVYVEKPKPESAGVGCDKCGRPMVIRKSRRGPFLSCAGFPKCRNAMPMEKLDHLKELAEKGLIPEAPVELPGKKNGRGAGKGSKEKVDLATLGPPPKGFAWTRTGRPVVEVWPEDDLKCPECNGYVSAKSGRFGPYFGCSSYPKCRFVANTRGEAKKRAEIEFPDSVKPKAKPTPTDIPCDECGEPMVIRAGRTGPFLGCSKYPKCKASKPLPEGVGAGS